MFRRLDVLLVIFWLISMGRPFHLTADPRVRSPPDMRESFGIPSRNQLNNNRVNEIFMTGEWERWAKNARRSVAAVLLAPSIFLLSGGGLASNSPMHIFRPVSVKADDELAKFAAEGNSVGVDGSCFMKKCALETTSCANDPTCLKGLSCLARCKGGSMCSTGCFAKYGSERLDNLLACTVEKNDCVHVPREANSGWSTDTLEDLPRAPLAKWNPSSLDGTWYKVMGLDSRYDCFDCQRNSFKLEEDKETNEKVLAMEALFRIPRPTAPGYLQSRISEKLHMAPTADLATMQSQGQMFGLTFWENWYVIGDSKAPGETFEDDKGRGISFGVPAVFAAQGGRSEQDMKLIFYTGHTLQGSYKGAFLYSRSPKLSLESIQMAKQIITKAGLNPSDFCVIRNQCFVDGSSAKAKNGGKETLEMVEASLIKDGAKQRDGPWWLGGNFFASTRAVAMELADWFEDPTVLSEWLLNQQEHMVFTQPLAVSPFASLPEDEGNR